MSDRMRSWGVAVFMAAAFAALSAAYVVVVPLWETPDEPSHVSTVLLAAATRHVPTARTQPLFPGVTPNAKLHPPLYFALMGIVCPAGLDVQPQVTGNPLAGVPAEVAKYRHEGGIPADRFPGAAFLRWMRGVSVVMGVVTLMVVWRTIRLVDPRSLLTPLMGIAVFGLAPTFVFAHAAVDPLPLAILSASLTVHHMVRLYLKPVDLRSMRLLGVLLVIGLGVRATLLFLYVPAAFLVWREKGRRMALAGQIIGPTVLVLIWMLVLWPRPTLLAYRHLAAQLVKVEPVILAPSALKSLVLQTKNSFWARFGWANLHPPAHLIDVFDLFSLIIAGSWVARLVRRSVPAGAGFAAAVAAIGLAGYLRANLAQFDPQGRYVGILIAAYAPLGGVGLATPIGLLKRPWHRAAAVAAVVTAMLGVNAYSLARVIAPAYATQRYAGLGVDAYQNQGVLVAEEASAGQSFTARRPGLTRIELCFTPARHSPPRTLEFRLMESPLIPEPLAVAREPYPTSGDHPQTVGFTFLPQWDSEDRGYFVRVALVPEDGPVRAWYIAEDAYTGGARYANDMPAPGDMRFTTYYALPSTGGPAP